MKIRYTCCVIMAAALSLAVCSNSSEACRGHRGYYSMCCNTSGCCPCNYCYYFSAPKVDIDGPFPTLIRGANMYSGVYVDIIAPLGAPPHPTDSVYVSQNGQGQFCYVGYNKSQVTPGLPGSSYCYRIYLATLRAGMCNVSVAIRYSDGTVKAVPFVFDIAP